MKRLSLILIMVTETCLAASSGFETSFQRAEQAYDAGNYAEAATLYESMLSNGVSNVEVHYNLANAHFKAGQLPEAVREYRTAWYEAPRDPDIAANLHFALNAAGAVESVPSITERFMTTLSSREWIWTATGSYLAACLLVLLGMLNRRGRPVLLKLSLVPLLSLLVSAGGWTQWQTFRSNPEAVVQTGSTALFGPMEGATAHYKLPAGALVRQRNTDPKGWIEVEYDGKNGWIKQENIALVSP